MKLSEEEQIEFLRKFEKISSVKAPNQFGQKWVARLIYIVDADTLTVAKYDETDGSVDRYIIRITEIGNLFCQNINRTRNQLMNVIFRCTGDKS